MNLTQIFGRDTNFWTDTNFLWQAFLPADGGRSVIDLKSESGMALKSPVTVLDILVPAIAVSRRIFFLGGLTQIFHLTQTFILTQISSVTQKSGKGIVDVAEPIL